MEKENDGISKKKETLETLANTLLRKRNEAVEFRASSGVERRWREDERIFEGEDPSLNRKGMIDYAIGDAYATQNEGPRRSEAVVNIIRSKCETAEGRFSDIQLPVDDKNYGLKLTPVPEISDALKNDNPITMGEASLRTPDGQPVKVADYAKKEQDKLEENMRAMEDEIDDQLTECGFNGESRKLIRSAVRLGTGILKGPNVVKQLKKVWRRQADPSGEEVHVLQVEEDFQPASKWVECWNVYPDPDVGEDISRAAYIWERGTILPRELRDLIGVEGYFNDEIIKILREEPRRLHVATGKDKKHRAQNNTASRGSHYEMWEYYGDLDKDDLLSLGIDVDKDDPGTVSACVVFVNDRPIKVMLNTLDTGELPYDFFTWTQMSGSPWGIGIPRMLVWLQRIVNAAWRAMLDNAGDSAGANIVLGNGILPDDGIWEITGKKIWRALGEDFEDVRKEFAQFQVANNQSELQAIIELALRFVDMETSLPMMFQGEQSTAPETLGATNIIIDANNVALRSRVKLYDDMITRPHITRYYNWNMQYNPKEEIKGDYNVDVRGTSVLLQKDQQAQTLMQVLQAKADPDINLLVNWEKATRQMFSALRLDILKTEEELTRAKEKLQQAQPQQQDPKIVAAQMKVQGEMQKAQLVQESDMAEIQTKGQILSAELQFKAREAEMQRQHEAALAQMEYNIKVMEFAEKRNMSLETIKAKLTGDAMKLKTQIQLSKTGAKGPQVMTPPVEPGGRAKEGQAFQA